MALIGKEWTNIWARDLWVNILECLDILGHPESSEAAECVLCLLYALHKV